MTDNKNLVIRSEQHLMAQVEAANTRLAISLQLTQDVERRRFVEILKRIDTKQAVAFLSVYACLSDELINMKISGIGRFYQLAKPYHGH